MLCVASSAMSELERFLSPNAHLACHILELIGPGHPCYPCTMRYGSCVLRLAAVLLFVAHAVAAQQEQPPKDLRDPPAPKEQQPVPKRENPIKATVDILAQRSAFFPDLATSQGPLSSKQKFEL